MVISLSVPDSFKELVENRTDAELSVLFQQALLLPSVTNQLKMLEAIGLSTLQGLLDLRRSGVMVHEQPTRAQIGSVDSGSLSIDDIDLSALDGVNDLSEKDEVLNNETVFGKLRAQILEGVDINV